MEKTLISLQQRSELMRLLTSNVYAEHFVIYDLTHLPEKLEGMTEKQWFYFLVLLSKQKWFDIKNLLDHFINHK